MGQKLPAFVLNKVVAGDEGRDSAVLAGDRDADQLSVNHFDLQLQRMAHGYRCGIVGG
jgi:hypothetical protein